MTTAGVIVLLLVAIALLLCEKQEDRSRALGGMVLIGILGLALYRIWPLLRSSALLAISPLVSRFGWFSGIVIAIIIAINIPIWAWFFGHLMRGAWSDAKENRAIRAGSKDAFDKRVEAYKSMLNYDERKAIEATLRIRDGGK